MVLSLWRVLEHVSARPDHPSLSSSRAQITSNLKNTITGMKAIVGKKFNCEDITTEADLVGFKMQDVAGKVGIPINYNDEQIMMTPERAMSMLLKCMQKIAEMDQNGPVTDVVLSVPAYFTDVERHAMLDAASIAGLNCLRLMNDVTAAALSYGIYKTDMPADTATHVAFVDCGSMDTTVSIVSFVKGKLTVLSTACDRHLGGRDFDMILAQHFAAEWKEKHKIDALSDKKAMYRLVTAAEKTKKVLSANPQVRARGRTRAAWQWVAWRTGGLVEGWPCGLRACGALRYRSPPPPLAA